MFMRKLQCLLFTLCILLVPAIQVLASEETEKALSTDETALLLRQLSPEIEVLSVKPAPVEGLWEAVVKVRGQTNIIYIDDARQNVILGSIVNLATKLDVTRMRLEDVRKIDVSQIPLDDALVMGRKDAKHKVIVFDDPD
jgi:thiol:disulfide interchange protein DsbC